MKPLAFLLVFVFIIALIGCGNDGPPTARIIPEELSIHGDVRTDNYYWLRERENPEVIAYLEAENEYAAGLMTHTEELQNTLFEEIKGRIKPNDESVPVLLNGYYYYTRFEEGTEYPIYCRKEGSLEAEEEVILNVNEMAGDHEFFSVTGVVASPDNNLLAYSLDTVGRRKYELHFKNLLTGEQLETIIKDVTGRAVWANDNNTVFYTRRDPDTLRAFQIYRQALDGESALVFQEDDVIFSCGVDKSKSREYIIISSDHTLSNEYRYLEADNPTGEFRIIQSRERGLEYHADQLGGFFYILTNMDAKNFRLMRAPLNATEKENWEEVIPHRDDILLQGFELFKNHLAVSERGNAVTRVRIIPWSGDGEHYVEFPEEVCAADISRSNPEFDTDLLRLNYSSLITPESVYDYNMSSREKLLKKQDEVPGYNRDAYTTSRLWAPADDGKEVPVSLVYKTE
ncbi:MAG: oligopeptidase B, partial [Acidobacteriota bacterium]